MFALTDIEAQAVLLSLRVAFWATLVSLPIGVGVAWLLARRQFPGHSLLNAIVHLPLVVPPVVVGYLLLLMLGRSGPLGALLDNWFGLTVAFTWQGAAVASAVMAFPLLVRAIRLSLEAVDQRLESAARTLGAPAPWVFATVTLPLIVPGILAGAILAFARSLGEFGATITFVSNIPGETRTLPLALYNLTQSPDGDSAALRLMIVSVIIAVAALLVSEMIARRVRARIGSGVA
jgi:molybdate transport system permease protein